MNDLLSLLGEGRHACCMLHATLLQYLQRFSRTCKGESAALLSHGGREGTRHYFTLYTASELSCDPSVDIFVHILLAIRPHIQAQ